MLDGRRRMLVVVGADGRGAEAVRLAQVLVETANIAPEDALLCLSGLDGDVMRALGARPATTGGVSAALRDVAARGRLARPDVLVAFLGEVALTDEGEVLRLPDDDGIDSGVRLDALFRWGARQQGLVGWLLPVEAERTRPPLGQWIVTLVDMDVVREAWENARRKVDKKMEFDAGHMGIREFDILVPGVTGRVGSLVVNVAQGGWLPAMDSWWWDPTRTPPWPDLFALAQAPVQPSGVPLPQGREAVENRSFANAVPMSAQHVPDLGLGKVWQLVSSKNGLSMSMNAHLYRYAPLGQPPQQRWFASPPFSPGMNLPVDSLTTVWFSRITSPLPVDPQRLVLDLNAIL